MFSYAIITLALAASTVGLVPRGGITGCKCPIDLNGDEGELINFVPAYQCAYPGGACTWLDRYPGDLQNTHQTNCPLKSPCWVTGCRCLTDNNGDSGTLINRINAYQCAYPSGACAWGTDSGELLNTFQTNCVKNAKCEA